MKICKNCEHWLTGDRLSGFSLINKLIKPQYRKCREIEESILILEGDYAIVKNIARANEHIFTHKDFSCVRWSEIK